MAQESGPLTQNSLNDQYDQLMKAHSSIKDQMSAQHIIGPEAQHLTHPSVYVPTSQGTYQSEPLPMPEKLEIMISMAAALIEQMANIKEGEELSTFVQRKNDVSQCIQDNSPEIIIVFSGASGRHIVHTISPINVGFMTYRNLMDTLDIKEIAARVAMLSGD